MSRVLKGTRLMWIEFTNQPGLLDFIAHTGFLVFDTEYFIFDEPNESSLAVFDASRTDIPLSTGRKAWFGFRKLAWRNFEQQFQEYQRDLKMVQTDLVCINRQYIKEFLTAMGNLQP